MAHKALPCLILAVLLVCSPTLADTKDFEQQAQRLMTSAARRFTDFPESLVSDKDAFLHMKAGAASAVITIAVRPDVQRETAETLETVIQGTMFEGNEIRWSHGKRLSVGVFEYSNPRIFARDAETVFPVGRLLYGLREAGFEPHAVLGVCAYADAGFEARRSTKFFVWEDISRRSDDFVLTVRGHVPNRAIDPLAVMAIAFPLLSGVALVLALRMARNERLPIRRRKQLYLKTLVYSYAAAWIVILCGMFYLPTERAQPICDVWLGSTSRLPSLNVSAVLVIGAIYVVGTSPLFTGLFLMRRLFPVAGPETVDQAQAEIRKEEGKHVLWNGLFTFLGIALMFGADVLPITGKAEAATKILGLMIAWAGVYLLYQQTRKRLTPVLPSESMYQRIEDIARLAGIRLRSVKIDDSLQARKYMRIVTPASGRFTISRKAVEVLTPDELDYLVKLKLSWRQPNVSPFIFTFAVLLATFFWLPANWKNWYTWGIYLLAASAIFLKLWWTMRKLISWVPNVPPADQTVAESAMSKLAEHLPGSDKISELEEPDKSIAAMHSFLGLRGKPLPLSGFDPEKYQ